MVRQRTAAVPVVRQSSRAADATASGVTWLWVLELDPQLLCRRTGGLQLVAVSSVGTAEAEPIRFRQVVPLMQDATLLHGGLRSCAGVAKWLLVARGARVSLRAR